MSISIPICRSVPVLLLLLLLRWLHPCRGDDLRLSPRFDETRHILPVSSLLSQLDLFFRTQIWHNVRGTHHGDLTVHLRLSLSRDLLLGNLHRSGRQDALL